MHPHIRRYPLARVFCIGRNYAEHIRELGDMGAAQCVVFMKPAASVLPPDAEVRIPREQGPVHHECEVVVGIGRDAPDGKSIPLGDALFYVDAVSLGLDLTLREVQNRLKSTGQPWELCKSFEGSAPLGPLVPVTTQVRLDAISFQCRVNGVIRQEGNTRDMLFPVPRIIEILSRSWRLRAGDLIFTGTPPGVGPLESGDLIEAESPQIGAFSWKIV
jgi:2-keto-4-pentenoate hydratase/2-oxohepta-3-ene-1,7-dioic acid hydratase in catechol pathway